MGIEFLELHPLVKVCAECEEVKKWGVDCACAECDYALCRFQMVKVED